MYEFNRDEADVVNRMASLVELKLYWCGCGEVSVIQDRTSVFPKAFTELTFGLSNILKVAPFTFYQVYEIFGLARYGVGDFSSFVGCKKSVTVFFSQTWQFKQSSKVYVQNCLYS